MIIWIDNDGCPRIVRELVYKAAIRVQCRLLIVGNSWMRIPESPLFEMIVVPGGFDAVDDYIAAHVEPMNLVITADIPLAARIVEKKSLALSPHGDIFDANTIAEKLAVRNLMQELRSAGDIRGGHGIFDGSNKQKFANAFDRLVSQLLKTTRP
jgi:uncharacterized protein YaiI (UPF0178 family)